MMLAIAVKYLEVLKYTRLWKYPFLTIYHEINLLIVSANKVLPLLMFLNIEQGFTKSINNPDHLYNIGCPCEI